MLVNRKAAEAHTSIIITRSFFFIYRLFSLGLMRRII